MKNFRKTAVAGLLGLGLVVSGCTAVGPSAGEVAYPAAAEAPVTPNWAEAVSSNVVRPGADGASLPALQVQAGRKQSFRAVFTLNITDPAHVGVKKAQALAEKFSGYSVYSNLERLEVKIPVKNAELFMAEVEKLGVVTQREISAQDVTEQYTDWELKCKNLRALRDRFAELLKKAVKVEDILKIESELARITTELEMYQGKLKVLKKSVDMVTIEIAFNTVAAANIKPIPVLWVRSLGTDILSNGFETDCQSVTDEFPVKAALPAGFITTLRNKNCLQALNADNVLLQMRSMDDLPGATSDFYQKLIKLQLKQNGFVDIVVKDTIFPGNHPGFLVTASRGEYAYSVVIAFYRAGWLSKQDKILVIEILGKTSDMKNLDTFVLTRTLEF